jgi:hypothetical protein
MRDPVRGLAWHPRGDFAIGVGDAGSIVVWDGAAKRSSLLTPVNLRRCAFHPRGNYCLIVGNDGLAVRWQQGSTRGAGWGHGHLRDISWRPDGALALIAANFGLYRHFEMEEDLDKTHELVDGDFAGVDFNDTGTIAVAVGYRQRGENTRDRETVLTVFDAEGNLLDMPCAPEPGFAFTSINHRPRSSEWWLVRQPAYHSDSSAIQVWSEGAVSPETVFEFTHLSGIEWSPDGSRAIAIGTSAAAFWRA